MGGEWRNERLSSLCEAVVDCPHSTPVWAEVGFTVLRSHNIRGGRLDLADRSYTDHEHFQDRTRRAKPQGGDLVITREAPMGEVCILPQGIECCLGQRMVLLRPSPFVVDGRFLLYALQSPHVQEQIRWNEGTGSTVSNLRIPVLESLQILLPPLPEQRAIARILGALDDKIELNRKMNATLEAMARALFKSWFVDFDPVRAKAEGRPPSGMDAETAKLFPSEFVESELGMIPKGWRIGKLGETSRVVMGQSPPGDTYNELGSGTPFFQGSTDFGFRFPSRRVFCTAPTRLAEVGDALVSVRAPVGALNMAIETCALGRGVAAVRHRSNSRSFTYYLIHSMKSGFEPYDAEGTVFGSINKAAFEGLRHVEPTPQIVEALSISAGSLDERIEVLTKESVTLARLRDELLPRLLSGELSVAAAERIASDAR